MLFSVPVQDITFQDIENFCRIWSEGVRVEYKRELATHHIPKVVSSFANTSGGVWIIGVATDAHNRPVFPIGGFPRTAGIEERITQSCFQNLYPPLLPEIKIIDVPNSEGAVVAVVQIGESIEAPHAIENSTKVYVRTNSTTETIQLAEIDRIEYLLKRRQQPEQKREAMIGDMAKRSSFSTPFLRVVVSPRYPWHPLLGEETLIGRLQGFSQPGTYENLRHFIRLVRQGLMSEPNAIPDQGHAFHFEANLYGVVSCYVRLAVDGPRLFLDQIVSEIGMALTLARHLLNGTNTNFIARADLQNVRNTSLILNSLPIGRHSIEDGIQAEVDILLEGLNDPLLFQDQVAELVRQLMWSYNWAARERIVEATRALLTRYQLP